MPGYLHSKFSDGTFCQNVYKRLADAFIFGIACDFVLSAAWLPHPTIINVNGRGVFMQPHAYIDYEWIIFIMLLLLLLLRLVLFIGVVCSKSINTL